MGTGVTIDPAAYEREVHNKIFACVCLATGLEGDIAAIGVVDKGGVTEQVLAFIMARGTEGFANPSRHRLHLFGRFAPNEDALDPVDAQCPFIISGRWQPQRYSGPSAHMLRAQCAKILGEDRVLAYPGPVGETIAALPDTSLFCLLPLLLLHVIRYIGSASKWLVSHPGSVRLGHQPLRSKWHIPHGLNAIFSFLASGIP